MALNDFPFHFQGNFSNIESFDNISWNDMNYKEFLRIFHNLFDPIVNGIEWFSILLLSY